MTSKTKAFVVAVTALIAAGPAVAADLPSRAAPPVYTPPPPPVFTWTGLYVGGQVGYEFGHNYWNTPALGGAYSPNGVVGGAHVGYNYQMGSFVVGVEGDVNGSNYSGTQNLPSGTSFGSHIPVDGSVRGRVGFAFDRALIYATGGAALASIHDWYSPAAVFGLPYQSITQGRVGWTVGGGVEYALTNNWSVRAEYRYTDYGHVNDAPNGIPISQHDVDQRVQLGVSYKFDLFGPSGPVAAAY